jgi:L-tryptophan--pyruvate aminotransferase
MDADEFLWISDVKQPKRDNPSSYDQAGHTEKESVEWAIVVATVERTMKKYADNLLHVLEGMSGRLSQLEFNSQRIEHTVQEFKVESADNHGAADGKLRSLENIIREVILS